MSVRTNLQLAMFTGWVALFVLASLLPQLGDCAATPYTVNIGSQATIVGYEYDSPASRQFLGIPYAQSISERNRFTVYLHCTLFTFDDL